MRVCSLLQYRLGVGILAILCVAMIAPTPVGADNGAGAASSGDPFFSVDPRVDAAVIVTTTTLWLLPTLWLDELPRNNCGDRCDRREVNSLDALVIDFQSEGARTASNVMTVALPLAAATFSFADYPSGGAGAVVQDLVLMGEAVAVSGALTGIIKLAVGRPRPYMYRGNEDDPIRKQDSSDYRSFPSGHTSTVFAATTAFAYIFAIRRPSSRLKWLPWTLAILSSSAVAATRVAAGVHFFTDVAAGALIGTVSGIGVPAAHRASGRKGSLTFHPSASPSYAGLTCTF